MMNQLQEFHKAFTDLFLYQQSHLNSYSKHMPVIGQTCIPNTYLVNFIPNEIPCQYIDRKKSEQSNNTHIDESHLQSLLRPLQHFPQPPTFPQFTAHQIGSLTPSQLTFVLATIKEDQLDETQRDNLSKIKQTLIPQNKKTSDSKNIPKNFTKAIFSYAMTHEHFLSSLLEHENLTDKKDLFIEWLKVNKKDTHNTKQLRQLNSQDHEFSRAFQLMQQHFLKYNTACYIFNSRIENAPAHLKARQNIQKQLFHDQDEK